MAAILLLKYYSTQSEQSWQNHDPGGIDSRKMEAQWKMEAE